MRPASRRSALALALCLAVAAPCLRAEAAPLDRTVRVQGRLDTSSGVPASGTYAVTLGLFAAETGGSPAYTQTYPSLAVTAGLFDVDLGPVPAGVLEAAPMLWLETKVGTDTLPRQPLRSTPYALVAERANVALVAQDLACSGCVADADVAFPYAAAASKGGDAIGLDCPGCVEASDLAAGAVAASHVQAGAISPDKVGFTYAGSATKGGAATGLSCTGCVGGGALAANLALSGTVSVTGGLNACTAGASGCAVKVADMGLYDHGTGALTLQAAAGLRVRDAANGAFTALQSGPLTTAGDASIVGHATVQGTLAAAAVGAGTQTPGATLEVAGNALMGGANRYLNFGSTVGDGGYGIRDAGGKIQVKNQGGDWVDVYQPPPPAFGSAKDGNLVLSSPFDLNTQASNGRTKADGIAYAASTVTGSTVATTQAPDGIVAGDKILLLLAQATGSTVDVGNWELLDVKGVTGSQISVVSGSIDPSRFDDGTGKKLVVQRVPQYGAVTINTGGTITASAWDGLSTTGAAPSGNMRTGIVAFVASGTVTIGGGGIDVSQRGFRGGAAGGAAEDATRTAIQSGGGNGGNGGIFANGGAGGGSGSGGAGGSAGTSGGAGGRGGGGGASSTDTCCHGNNASGQGGAGPFGSGVNPSSGDALTLGGGAAAGGGGGAGGWASPCGPTFSNVATASGLGGHHSTNPAGRGGNGSAGAAGGGLVIVYAKVLAGTGPITANGGKGGSGGGGGGGMGYDGTGGGGGGGGADGAAGGTILVRYELSVGSPTVSAQGGDGGGGGGGGGGDGGGGAGGGGGGVGGGGGGGGTRSGQTCGFVGTNGSRGGDGGQAGFSGWSGDFGGGGGQANGGGGSTGSGYNAPANGGGITGWSATNGSNGSGTVNGGAGGNGGGSNSGWSGGGGGGQAGQKGTNGFADMALYVPADLAEWMPSRDAGTARPGDLLVLDGTGGAGGAGASLVRRSASPHDDALVGVVSTYPSLQMGGPHAADRDVLVALAGRVPVRVTTEGGPIRPGDPIVTSSQPGVGMKATRGGKIAGYALGAWDRPGVGLVTVLLGSHHWPGSGDAALSDVLDVLEEQERRLRALEERCGTP